MGRHPTTHSRNASATSSWWMSWKGRSGTNAGRPGRRPQPGTEAPHQGFEHSRDAHLGAHRVGAEDDRRSQQVERGLRVRYGLLFQQVLQLRLLLGVEEPAGRTCRPVLGDADRVVGVEAIGRDRRGVDEPLGTPLGGRTEGVDRALDVDRVGLLLAASSGSGTRDVRPRPRPGTPSGARRRRARHRAGTPSSSSRALPGQTDAGRCRSPARSGRPPGAGASGPARRSRWGR